MPEKAVENQIECIRKHFRCICEALGHGWKLAPDEDAWSDEDVWIDGNQLVSMEVIARNCTYPELCVHIIRDRGVDIVLVGTWDADDLYPIEDVAFAKEWCGFGNPVSSLQHYLQKYDSEDGPPDPPFKRDQSLKLIAENIQMLNNDFNKDNKTLRKQLRRIASDFQNTLNKNSLGRG